MVGDAAEALGAAISRSIHPVVEQYAQLYTHGARTPVLRFPDEYGMEYEELFFPSLDDVPLDGWFIPADRIACSSSIIPCLAIAMDSLATWLPGIRCSAGSKSTSCRTQASA